ncbi:MAG TPA: galactokinase family protein [Blastocatellia bacterium]|nr:galactokinase family protein [Blastocatellia bacterium]HNG30374.1 galactokinase family protein [Blastocatellia bacterium]
MFQLISGETHNLPDVAEFIETLNSLARHPAKEARELFAPGAELFVARAPGRLDVMGGIADYSGSLVLEMPIREATFAALQRDAERRLKIVSLQEDGAPPLVFEMPLSDFDGLDYAAACRHFRRDATQHWAAYVAGVFLVLMRECDTEFREGARLLISSRVPQGKGVSSSAALEVATMQAVAAAFGTSLNGRETAILCQMVENLVAGAPCGVMDQMTAACGAANQLLALLCQPAELSGLVSIPDEIQFWGLDSGVRHAVTGADYGSVRVGAFMGYRILAELAGLTVTPAKPVNIDDARWSGYLANVTPSEFEQHFAARLPERIGGADFLNRYGGTTDGVTQVDPDKTYAVRIPATHAIYEHHRVRLFAELLGAGVSERNLELLGELMFQSHASYSACGLGSAGTDRLVELVRETKGGLYGAKITGGGSGGTVAILGRRNATDAVAQVAERYALENGHPPYVFSGSSPGSAAFGHLRLSEGCAN